MTPRFISAPSPLSLLTGRCSPGSAGTRPLETQGRDLPRPGLRVAGSVGTQARPGGSTAATSSLGPPLTLLPLYLSSAGMEASWRQVAAGRGRARGRAAAVPSSGNGDPLGGAGGGRVKGSGSAVPSGPSPGGAATLPSAGRRQRSAGGEAMQILGTSGEDGSGPWPYQPPQALTNLSVVLSALVVSSHFFFP